MEVEVIRVDLDNLPMQLRQIRSQKKITQRQLAERAQVSQQTVSAIEHGRIEPSLKVLSAIALALGVSLIVGAIGEIRKQPT